MPDGRDHRPRRQRAASSDDRRAHRRPDRGRRARRRPLCRGAARRAASTAGSWSPGDEPHPPYERPALSKELLAGSRAASGPGAPRARILDGTRDRAPAGDAHRQRSTCAPAGHVSAAASIRWRRLVLATGVRARRIPRPGRHGRHPPPAHPRRCGDPAGRARAAALASRSSAPASSASRWPRAPGRSASRSPWSSRRPVPFERTLGPTVGSLLAERAPARRRRPAAGHARSRRRARWRRRGRAVELGDGTRLACDAVLVGVGARPNAELAAGLLDARAGRGYPDRRLWAHGGRRGVRLRRRRKRRAPVPGPARQARALERRRGDGPGHRRRHPRPRAGTLARAVLLVGSVRVADSGGRPRRPGAPRERRRRRRALRGAVPRQPPGGYAPRSSATGPTFSPSCAASWPAPTWRSRADEIRGRAGSRPGSASRRASPARSRTRPGRAGSPAPCRRPPCGRTARRCASTAGR